MLRRALPTLVVTALAFTAGARWAAASPLEEFGFGARDPAMGAVGAASAEDYECIYSNPAGLSEVHAKRFSAGVLLGTFNLTGADRVVDDAEGIEVGVTLPVPFQGALKDRVGFGFGIYVPTQYLNRARAPQPGQPFFALLENRHEVVGVQIGMGVKITDKLSVGAGVLVLAALTGHIDVTTDAAGRFTTQSETQLIADYAPILGARYKLAPNLTLGAAFRTRSESSYSENVNTDLGQVLPVKLPQIIIGGVAQYDPMAGSLEAAWRPIPSLLLVGQLAYEHWSPFPQPTKNPLVTAPPQSSPDFKDTLVPRVGVEYTHHVGDVDLAFRGGYFLAVSPAPTATATNAFFDNTRHVLTGGLGLATLRTAVPLHIDAFFQAHLLTSRDEPAFGLSTSGNIWIGGLVVGVELL